MPDIHMAGGELFDTVLQRLIYEGLPTRFLVIEEFNGGMVGVAPSTDVVRAIPAGAGAGILGGGGAVKTNRPGFWRVNTGTDVNGRTFLISENVTGFHIGLGGKTRVGTFLRTGPTLSTALERYLLRAGIFSITTTPQGGILEGVGIEYIDNENGGRWQGVCVSGSVETSRDLTVAVVASTDYFLEAEINEDGTSVQFFINGVAQGLPVTTNIPQGTGFNLFYNGHIYKLTGTTNRFADWDALYIYKEVARP